MITHVKGDLLALASAGHFDFIVHGCNCFNTMGSGIARQIQKRYPEAYAADTATIRGDYNKLGTYTQASVRFGANVGSPFTIINAYTQFGTSRNGEDVFEYASFVLICQKLAFLHGEKRFGLPYIGMGLAGGNSETIMAIIEQFAQSCEQRGGSVTLVEFLPV